MTKNQLEKINEQRKTVLDLLLEMRQIHDNLGSVRHKNIIKLLYDEAVQELDEMIKNRNNNNTKN